MTQNNWICLNSFEAVFSSEFPGQQFSKSGPENWGFLGNFQGFYKVKIIFIIKQRNYLSFFLSFSHKYILKFPEAPLHVKSQQIKCKSKQDNPAISYQDKHYRDLKKSNIMPLYSLISFLANIVIFIKILFMFTYEYAIFNMLIYFNFSI